MNSRPVEDIAARLISRAVPSLTALSLLATPLFAQEETSTFAVLGKAGIIGLFIMLLSIVAVTRFGDCMHTVASDISRSLW